MNKKSNRFESTLLVRVTTQDKLRLEQLAAEQRCSVGAMVGTFLAMVEPTQGGEKG